MFFLKRMTVQKKNKESNTEKEESPAGSFPRHFSRLSKNGKAGIKALPFFDAMEKIVDFPGGLRAEFMKRLTGMQAEKEDC